MIVASIVVLLVGMILFNSVADHGFLGGLFFICTVGSFVVLVFDGPIAAYHILHEATFTPSTEFARTSVTVAMYTTIVLVGSFVGLIKLAHSTASMTELQRENIERSRNIAFLFFIFGITGLPFVVQSNPKIYQFYFSTPMGQLHNSIFDWLLNPAQYRHEIVPASTESMCWIGAYLINSLAISTIAFLVVLAIRSVMRRVSAKPC